MEILFGFVSVITSILTSMIWSRFMADRYKLSEDDRFASNAIFLVLFSVSTCLYCLLGINSGIAEIIWTFLGVTSTFITGLVTFNVVKAFYNFGLPGISNALNNVTDKLVGFGKALFTSFKKKEKFCQAHEIKRLEALVSELSLRLEPKNPSGCKKLPAVLADGTTLALSEKLVKRRHPDTQLPSP